MDAAPGSGNLQLSDKIMTQYHSRLMSGKKPEAISLGRKLKITNDGADVEATRDWKRIRQKEKVVSHSLRGGR
jgi:hypothetical protein